MNKNMKNRISPFHRLLSIAVAVAVMGALVLLPGGFAFAENSDKPAIVSVDTSRILEAHPAFAEARETFETELKGMQQQLENMEEEQKAMAQQQMQQQVQQRGEQLQEEAMAKLQKDIEKIAEEKGYDYVVDSNLLIAGGKNVTQEVMKALDLKTNQSDKAE